MKVKAIVGFETMRHEPEEDEHGSFTLKTIRVEMKEGEIGDIDDKVANRLIGYGHVSTDLSAETHNERLKREAAEPLVEAEPEAEPQAPAEEAAPAAPADPAEEAEPAEPADAPAAAN